MDRYIRTKFMIVLQTRLSNPPIGTFVLSRGRKNIREITALISTRHRPGGPARPVGSHEDRDTKIHMEIVPISMACQGAARNPSTELDIIEEALRGNEPIFVVFGTSYPQWTMDGLSVRFKIEQSSYMEDRPLGISPGSRSI